MVPKKPATHNSSQIGNLFERYKERLRPPQASVEKAFVSAIEEVVGYTVKKEQVTFSVATKTISLTVPAVLKSEIKRKQSEIESVLKKKLPAAEVPKVIL